MTHGAVAGRRPATREMVIVRRAFRREARLLAGLVPAVAPGDTARARVLAGAWRDYREALHHHHTGEDELLWPKLLARVDLEAEPVLRMEEQHAAIALTHDRIDALMSAWEAAAHVHTRDLLGAVLAEHHDALGAHLDEEERAVLPLVEQHLTAAEWQALTDRGRAHIPRGKLLLSLGALLEDATPAERAHVLAQVPPPVRLVWHTAGRVSYRRAMRRLRGR